MNFEKIKYSKCPNCKKYGINSSGKIGIRVCIPVKCKYCKKIFVINSALRIIILIFSPLVGGGIAIFLQRFFDESSKFPDIIGLLFAIVVLLFCEHFAKLEELTDERELERLKEEDDEEDWSDFTIVYLTLYKKCTLEWFSGCIFFEWNLPHRVEKKH